MKLRMDLEIGSVWHDIESYGILDRYFYYETTVGTVTYVPHDRIRKVVIKDGDTYEESS